MEIWNSKCVGTLNEPTSLNSVCLYKHWDYQHLTPHLSEKRHVPAFPVAVSLLDARIKSLNDIIQQLSADVIAPGTGTLQAWELIPAQKDLKRSKSKTERDITKCPRASTDIINVFCVWKHSLPDEGRGETQDDWAALRDAPATVEWISADVEVRGDEGGGAGAGYPQGSHGLAAQELSDAGAKHLPAVTISEKMFVTDLFGIFSSD